MPRNGLNESTSSVSATVKVTFLSSARGGRLRRDQRTACPRRVPGPRSDTGGSTVPAVTSPPRAAQRAARAHRARRARPDPYHWMRDIDSPELLAHLAAERRWYESATGHLSSLVETLRSEMTDRVPTTDRSVSWRHQGFYYYTVLPAGREYTQLLRDFDVARSGDRWRRQVSSCSTRTSSPTTPATSSSGSPWSARTTGCWPTPWTGPATRSTRCGSATSTPARTCRPGAPQLLRRRLERRLGRTSSTRSTTTPTGRSRSGGTRSAPRPTDDVLVLDEPDERFELERARDPQRRPGRDLVGEPRHQRGLGRSTPHDPLGAAALGGRPAPRRRVRRRARRARPTAPRRCCS